MGISDGGWQQQVPSRFFYRMAAAAELARKA
jgi:hypothetical protein